MSNAKQFEEAGNPWGYGRWEPTEPFCPEPDPDAGPIARPYNPHFKDAPKVKPAPKTDWRTLHRIRTVRGYTHKTIERPPFEPVYGEPVKPRDLTAPPKPLVSDEDIERGNRRWREFLASEWTKSPYR